jgi:hypothetical protein
MHAAAKGLENMGQTMIAALRQKLATTLDQVSDRPQRKDFCRFRVLRPVSSPPLHHINRELHDDFLKDSAWLKLYTFS